MPRSVSFTGHRKVDAAFANLETAIQKKVMRDALKRANNTLIHPEVKKRVPVGPPKPWLGYSGGYWKKSIKKRAIKRSRKRFGYETFSKKQPRENVPYHSGYPEFGTKTTNRPQHPMRKATYKHYDRVQNMVRKEVRRAIVALFRGMRKR